MVLQVSRTDFGDYEEDVMTEILARLPIKSLIRFRCVCKSWLALFSDSKFAEKHLSYAKRGVTCKLSFMMRPALFLDLEALKNVNDVDVAVTEVSFPVLDFDLDSEFRHIVGACNGLVCVNLHHKAILLWNPYTRDSKVFMLPEPLHEPTFADYYAYGFGYDSASDDYKFIDFIEWFTYGDPRVRKTSGHIFSLKTGSCRKINAIDLNTDTQGLFVNGALHWLCRLPKGGSIILSFDLAEEKFQQTIPLPYNDVFRDSFIHQDCLCVCALPNGTNTINIWMMKQYGVKESWTEVLRFSLENYVRQVDNRLCLKPVCILENGVVVIDTDGLTGLCERLMVLSNLKEKMHVAEVMANLSNLKEEMILAEEPELETVEDTELETVICADTELETVIYRETLVSPNIRT